MYIINYSLTFLMLEANVYSEKVFCVIILKPFFLYNHKNRIDLDKRDSEHYYKFERADENLQWVINSKIHVLKVKQTVHVKSSSNASNVALVMMMANY